MGLVSWWNAAAAAGFLALLLVACGSEPGDQALTPGSRGIGERCEKTEDCSSLVCVRLDDQGGVCSTTCENDQGCTASDNWACLSASGSSISVCACLQLSDEEVCGDALDNDCDAKVDDCRVCDGMSVPEDHHDHCGECGNACRNDQTCDEGVCHCTGLTPDDCGGICTSTQNDPGNCGECGTPCAPEQVCRDGACVCPDGAQPDHCPAVGCVSLAQDGDHCGTCENACVMGQVCEAGSCVCPAGAPPDFCEGIGCVDLQASLQNCGECGVTCVAGQLCTEGECVCPGGLTLCDDQCVNTLTDKANCGDCGETCPTDLACIQGECDCSVGGYSVCDDACANLSIDAEHCGDCETACGPGETCAGGDCGCDSGVYCDTTCMPQDDEQNCGTCGHACPTGQYCSGDECLCLGFGLSECGDDCFDLSTDEQNCGTCGKPCRTGEVCTSGLCACPNGQTYCESAGKCVVLASDAGNCGSCGHACEATEICSNSLCKCSVAGQLYCATEGVCTDTLSNEQHCGACDDACNPTEVCSDGGCACPSYWQLFCASENACIDVRTDSQHCGQCDDPCPGATHCASATCVCDAAGQTLCGTTCYDLQTNADHCGSCANDCGGNYVCTAGKCQCPLPTVGSAVRLTDNTVGDTRPVAAWDGTHVGVAYLRQVALSSVYNNVRFALLNPNGTVVTDIALTSHTDGQFEGPNAIDTPAITWNGSEYAVVWVDRLQSGSTLMMRRVSAAGVPSASVTLDTTNVIAQGAGVAWSTAISEYAVGAASFSSAYFRRVGAQGTTLQAPNNFSVQGTCYPSMAVAPDGTWALSCRSSSYLTLGIFNADGSRTLDPVVVTTGNSSVNSEVIWDGVTFSSVYVSSGGFHIQLHRNGGSIAAPPTLVPYVSPNMQSSVDIVGLGSSLALGHVSLKSFKLKRFTLPAALQTAPTAIHASVDIVATPNVLSRPDLVKAGTSALLAVWPDDRWGTGEIYAAPIDLKSCP